MAPHPLTPPPTSCSVIDRYLSDAYQRGYIPGLDGRACNLFPASISQSQGSALTRFVVAERAVHTVETGLGNGMAAVAICSGLIQVGGPAKHVAFDPYQFGYLRGAGARAVNDLQLNRWIDIRTVPSQSGLAHLVSSGLRFDLAFVDGDHRFDGVFVDLAHLNHLVRPSGLVIVDDIDLPSVRKAISFFLRNCGWVHENSIRDGSEMVVLRRPAADPYRAWHHFIDF